MRTIPPVVWIKLHGEVSQGEILNARIVFPELTKDLIAALDAEGKRHLLIPVKKEDPKIRDDQSRGLTVQTRELSMPNKDVNSYIDIVCHDFSGHEFFDLIGGEIVDKLLAQKTSANETVTQVLSKWRKFWGQAPRQILSLHEQIGLFAEISFLSRWLLPRTNAKITIAAWRGPYGSRHDFEWQNVSVEVKATTSTRGTIHRINGLDQLSPPEGGNLFLFSQKLREESGAINSLATLISTCRHQLESDYEALGKFESALAQVGYSPLHEVEYDKLRLRIVEESLYAVNDSFPQLNSRVFKSGIPSGIERIEYEINLTGFGDLIIAKSSSDMPDIGVNSLS